MKIPALRGGAGRAREKGGGREVGHGRFELSLSALTAMSAAVTGAEVYLENCRG